MSLKDRVLVRIGRIATGISVAMTVLGVILLFIGVINGAFYDQIMIATVFFGVVTLICYLVTGQE